MIRTLGSALRNLRVVNLRNGALFLLMLTVLSARISAAETEVLTPHSGGTVLARNPETHLILRQSPESEACQIRVEKTGAILDSTVSMEGADAIYQHFRLPLKTGDNRFTILPGGQLVELKFRRLQAELSANALNKEVLLFHQGESLPEACADCHTLQDTGIIERVGLQKQTSCGSCHQNIADAATWKHSPAENQQCLSCHQLSSSPWKIGFPTGKIQEVCLGCHTGKKTLFSQKVIHGPLNSGGCTLCHNPHGDTQRHYLWAEGSLALCIACHSNKENLVSKKDPVTYVHGIIFGEGCTVCHDPHATDIEFMLRKPINTLCVGCHPRFAGVTRDHPVAGHPLSGATEHARPGRKLTCSSCHEPHGSMNQYMLIENRLGGRLCRVCHKK